MLSEERQRKVYEWLYPELRGTDWKIQDLAEWAGNGVAFIIGDKWDGKARGYSELLYVHDDKAVVQPNYQFFFTEIVLRLKSNGVVVMYNNMGSQEYWLDPIDADALYCNADPIAATAEYIEALEGR